MMKSEVWLNIADNYIAIQKSIERLYQHTGNDKFLELQLIAVIATHNALTTALSSTG